MNNVLSQYLHTLHTPPLRYNMDNFVSRYISQ